MVINTVFFPGPMMAPDLAIAQYFFYTCFKTAGWQEVE